MLISHLTLPPPKLIKNFVGIKAIIIEVIEIKITETAAMVGSEVYSR